MELANAFSELNDPDEQRARFEAQRRFADEGHEEAMPLDEAYLQALEHGPAARRAGSASASTGS